MAETIGYGLIGAGAFGQFCLEQYRQMDEVRVVAIADANAEAARAAARNLGVEASPSVDALLARPDIQIVHIATPPFTHRELVLAAVAQRKHVLCEKPLAVTLEDADAMVAAAQARGCILSVNLIMRYNPLCESVRRVLESRVIGEPLHGFFENYAKDEPLAPSHWFWEREKAGGIFVEHGVHFFDLFRWWLGDGEVMSGQQIERPGRAGVYEQVQAVVRHGGQTGGVLVNHYHGFTQAARMDRQEMRLVCERGTIRLFEWVPTRAELDVIATRREVELLLSLLPDAEIVSEQPATGDDRRVTSRFKQYEIDGRFQLRAGAGMEKQTLYGHVVRSLLADQIAAIRDPGHQRRITEENGLTSLATAVRAQALADAAAR